MFLHGCVDFITFLKYTTAQAVPQQKGKYDSMAGIIKKI